LHLHFLKRNTNTEFNAAGGVITIVSKTGYKKPSFASPAVFDLPQAYNDGTGSSYRYMRIRATRLGDMATDDSVNRLQFKQIGAYKVTVVVNSNNRITSCEIGEPTGNGNDQDGNSQGSTRGNQQ